MELDIIKSSGLITKFSENKLKNSLLKSGADTSTIQHILETVKDELYPGISTREIYNRAFSMLKKKKPVYASKYKLKKAIYELGPTGYPFENFIGALLLYSGYKINLRKIVQGKCVDHEVDIVAIKNGKKVFAECKFHSDEGRYCDVKIPLYVSSRYQDILKNLKGDSHKQEMPNECWVVTNTRFTKDALAFGKCANLHLLSWDYPHTNSLKELIDRLSLYPITVSTLLTNREKQFLLSREVVLIRQLLNDTFYLDHLGVSEIRKNKIVKEIKSLINI
jgi:hypothetical protein